MFLKICCKSFKGCYIESSIISTIETTPITISAIDFALLKPIALSNPVGEKPLLRHRTERNSDSAANTSSRIIVSDDFILVIINVSLKIKNLR